MFGSFDSELVASYSSRRRMALARASWPVIQRLCPEADAIFPSSVSAHLASTKGRPFVIQVRKRSFCSAARRRQATGATTTP